MPFPLTIEAEEVTAIEELDDPFDEEDAGAALSAALVTLYVYTLSRKEPPQNSLEFPLHSIVQPLS